MRLPSGSVARIGVPLTRVPSAVFSSTLRTTGGSSGGSLTSRTVMITWTLPELAGRSLSKNSTVRTCVSVVSKSSVLPGATERLPSSSIWKMPVGSPPAIAKATTSWPGSGSLAMTVPMVVPGGIVSATVNRCGLGPAGGCSGTSLTLTVKTAWSVKVPSVTSPVMMICSYCSKLSCSLLMTRMRPVVALTMKISGSIGTRMPSGVTPIWETSE